MGANDAITCDDMIEAKSRSAFLMALSLSSTMLFEICCTIARVYEKFFDCIAFAVIVLHLLLEHKNTIKPVIHGSVKNNMSNNSDIDANR